MVREYWKKGWLKEYLEVAEERYRKRVEELEADGLMEMEASEIARAEELEAVQSPEGVEPEDEPADPVLSYYGWGETPEQEAAIRRGEIPE